MHHNVLRFDISMDNSRDMQLFNSSTNLFHDACCLDFRHGLASFKHLVELSSECKFQNNIDMFFIIKEAIHFDDISMTKVHLYFNFSDELLYQFFFDELGFLDGFQGTCESG